MLRLFAHLVACCCAKFETGQTFQPATPNISFVPWSPKRSATMLDPFAQLSQQFPTLLAQQCWELLRPFARSLRNDLFFTFYHSVLFMIIANITILIFFFMIKNIGTVIIIQLTKASTFLTITDVFSIAHLKVFQTPCINDDVSILLL